MLPPQHAKPARKSACCGVDDGSPRPHPLHPQPVGSGPRQHAPKTDGRARGSVQPRAHQAQATSAPPRRARAAPTARKASSQIQAGPQGGARPQAQQGDDGTRPPPEELKRRSTGRRQETQRGKNPPERPYRRPASEPRVVRAPHRPGGGGGLRRGSTRHTHATDTRRGPEGQPDRARGTHRPHGMAYRQAKKRDTRGGQNATRTARDARTGWSPRGEARTGTGPDPPVQPRAPRTHDQGTTPAKAVVAHSAMHQLAARQPPCQSMGVPLATSQ